MNSEQRQIINLSNRAYDVINKDCHKFNCTRSDLINTVIYNYYDNAGVSFYSKTVNREKQLEKILGVPSERKTEHDNKILQDAIVKIAAAEIDELKKEQKKYPKDHPLNVRFQNRLVEKLTSLDFRKEVEHYRNVKSAYFKALLEEYSLLPEYERYTIYFKELIQQIESCIASDRICEISFSDTFRNNHLIKPIKITRNNETYDKRPYLFCLENFSEDAYEYEYSAIEITEIRNIEQRSGRFEIGQKPQIPLKEIESHSFNYDMRFSGRYECFLVFMTDDELKAYNEHPEKYPKILSEELVKSRCLDSTWKEFKTLIQDNNETKYMFFYCRREDITRIFGSTIGHSKVRKTPLRKGFEIL